MLTARDDRKEPSQGYNYRFYIYQADIWLASISCHLIGRDFLTSHWIISILKRREIVIITMVNDTHTRRRRLIDYDTIRSRQRSFVRFWWLCFNWSQKVALWCIGLLFLLCGGIAAGIQTVNCELWPRLVTVQWSELWHVNSLQSLCWDIGDNCRLWNKTAINARLKN